MARVTSLDRRSSAALWQQLTLLQARVLRDGEDALGSWLELATRVVEADRGVILDRSEELGGPLRVRGAFPDGPDASFPPRVLMDARGLFEAPGERVARSDWECRPLVVDDVTEAVWCHPSCRADEEDVAALVVAGAALLARERRVEARRFELLQVRAEAGRLAEDLRTAELQLRDFDRLSTFEELLQVCEDIDELTEVVEYGFEKLFPDLATGLYLVGQDGNALVRSDAADGPALDVIPSADCIAMRRGRIHRTGPSQPLRCKHVGGHDWRAVCVPLIGKSETLGMLHVAAAPGSPAVARWSVVEALAATAARRSAVALANIRLSATLFDQTQRDAETGLFNRRHFERELARWLRPQGLDAVDELSLVLIDAAGYATIAEVFGMQAGMVVLDEITRALSACAQPGDLACRIGRELFALVMPEVGETDAAARVDGLLDAMSSTRLVHRGRALGRLACSAGIAVAPAHGRDVAGLVAAADAALVSARLGGEGSRFVAGETSAEGHPSGVGQRRLSLEDDRVA